MSKTGDGRDDALMFAITGERAPDATARGDEMAAATATVKALQRGLSMLGTELAQATPAPQVAAAPAEANRRRPGRSLAQRIQARPWTFAAAATVVGVALVGGFALSRPGPEDISTSRSLPGLVACAETIAVGDVTSVSRQGDRFAVTLGAVLYLKPETGSTALSVDNAQLFVGAKSSAPVKGGRALVVVHDAAKGNVDLFTGADIDSQWARMEKALPDARLIDPSECKGE